MKVGVLADTHFTSLEQGQAFARRLLSGHFSDIAAVLHAGDHLHPELESCFSPLPWYAVRGNMDTCLDTTPIKRTIRLAGKSIGMIHGWGAPDEVEMNVMNSFADAMPDVLVFGHTHYPVCRRVAGTLLFNPGSPTQRRTAAAVSVGILTIERDDISGRIVNLP